MRPSREMNGRSSVSQSEVTTPGILPDEGEVVCDEAESCCLCSYGSRHYRNMAPDSPYFFLVLIIGRKKKTKYMH